MAQLDKKVCPGDWTFTGDWLQRQESLYRSLEDASAAVDTKVSLVGAIVRFPFADGYALYRVSKDKPLTLQHIPFGDAWQVPYSQIRGLRRSDVIAMIHQDRRVKQIFSR